MASNWTFIKAITDGEHYEIEGLNIWDHRWIDTGETIALEDPIYGENHTFGIYQIIRGGKLIQFVAGEFSNCVWGIYLQR